jgi:hypothetical protein
VFLFVTPTYYYIILAQASIQIGHAGQTTSTSCWEVLDRVSKHEILFSTRRRFVCFLHVFFPFLFSLSLTSFFLSSLPKPRVRLLLHCFFFILKFIHSFNSIGSGKASKQPTTAPRKQKTQRSKAATQATQAIKESNDDIHPPESVVIPMDVEIR